jgi:DCN1-like protein 1/2
MPAMRAELNDPNKFKEFYKFVFDFSRDLGYKNISVDTAIGLWELLLTGKCKFL